MLVLLILKFANTFDFFARRDPPCQSNSTVIGAAVDSVDISVIIVAMAVIVAVAAVADAVVVVEVDGLRRGSGHIERKGPAVRCRFREVVAAAGDSSLDTAEYPHSGGSSPARRSPRPHRPGAGQRRAGAGAGRG